MGPTNNIGYLLQRLAFCLNRQNDHILQEQLGIGFSQFKILMILQWRPSVQQKQIADNLSQTEASISRQIKLLKEEGLLVTEINPQNKREHITKPTQKGMELTQRALEILNRHHQPMFAKLNPDQQAHLVEGLRIMYDYACANMNQKDKEGAKWLHKH
jgi:DNA-binding MarR family transcriptional regulator